MLTHKDMLVPKAGEVKARASDMWVTNIDRWFV